MSTEPSLGVASARAALVGNPSDGFGGATIALAIDQFQARVTAKPTPGISVFAEGSGIGATGWKEMRERRNEVSEGPLALLMAALLRAARHAGPDPEPVSLELSSTIPPKIGLAGSSAVTIAALRALSEFWGIPLEPNELAATALACEREDLGIEAGPQDRLAQAHGGLLEMRFAKGEIAVEQLNPELLPDLFLAYLPSAVTDSGDTHADMRARFDSGEPKARGVLAEIGALVAPARRALESGNVEALGKLMRRNVELRGRIYELDPRHMNLVEMADELGAPCNYTGSGGAIVAIRPPDITSADLRAAFYPLDADVLELGGLRH